MFPLIVLIWACFLSLRVQLAAKLAALSATNTITFSCSPIVPLFFMCTSSSVMQPDNLANLAASLISCVLGVLSVAVAAGIKTLLAASSCHDIVTADGFGSSIISGHFDRNVRFWDQRCTEPTNKITMEDRITSLDISSGQCQRPPTSQTPLK